MPMFHPQIETMPREELRALQLAKLKKQVEHAYNDVPFYKKQLDERGVRPEPIQSLKDVALLPLTMGIGYELIRLCGKHDNFLTRIIAAPGVWLQRITVREPDDDMIECAIAAMSAVIPENQPKAEDAEENTQE